jgi:hypothetical protein
LTLLSNPVQFSLSGQSQSPEAEALIQETMVERRTPLSKLAEDAVNPAAAA